MDQDEYQNPFLEAEAAKFDAMLEKGEQEAREAAGKEREKNVAAAKEWDKLWKRPSKRPRPMMEAEDVP
jgi:hypothetical protein